MVKDSIFRPIYDRHEKRLHLGYDYKGNILKNSISAQMIEVNVVLSDYLGYIEDVVHEWVESVKQIKIFANPALDKYDKNVR